MPDLDEIPVLSLEREALWKRLGDASFLTDDEKRAAVGYEPIPAASLTTLLAKFDPTSLACPAEVPTAGSGRAVDMASATSACSRMKIPMNWCRARSMRRTIRVAKRRELGLGLMLMNQFQLAIPTEILRVATVRRLIELVVLVVVIHPAL